MPEVHCGRGATMGSVIPTVGAIIPAVVGVDIGCGSYAVRTELTANDLPDTLDGVRAAIEATVPNARTNEGPPGDSGAWDDQPGAVTAAYSGLDMTLRGILDKPRG